MNTLVQEHTDADGRRTTIEFADPAARAELADHLDVLLHPAAHAGDDVEQVKINPSRTVWRCRLDGRDYYLKQFHSRDLSHRVGAWFRGSDAARELRLSRRLAAARIRAAEVLAIGCQGPSTWMLSRAVRSAIPADQWCDSDENTDVRTFRRVLRSTATLIGRMHAADILHHDLHAGNIMLAGERLEPVLMDLHRAGRRRRLSRRARAKNLALLMHDRRWRTTRTQRLRFLKRYLQAGEAAGSLRGWSILVEHFANVHARRLYAARDRRTRGENTYFTRLKAPGGWRGHAVLASKRKAPHMPASELVFAADAWRAALAEPEALFAGAEVVKDSASSLVVRRRLTVGAHELEVFIKRTRRPTLAKRLADLIRPSRPIRAFRGGHALITRRIPTALPLAAMERRRGPILLDSFLITEAIAPAETVTKFLQRCLDALDAPGERRAFMRRMRRAVVRLLRGLADAGFAHRDMKAGNLLVRAQDPLPPTLVLIDLDGLSRPRRLSPRRQFQALMRLNASLAACPQVTRTDRLRALLDYLGGPGSGRIHYKPYWRALQRWTERKLARRNRSKGTSA